MEQEILVSLLESKGPGKRKKMTKWDRRRAVKTMRETESSESYVGAIEFLECVISAVGAGPETSWREVTSRLADIIEMGR